MHTQNNPMGLDTRQRVDPDYPQMTTLHIHSLRMTLLLASQPRGGSLQKKVAANLGLNCGWARSSLHREEREEPACLSSGPLQAPVGRGVTRAARGRRLVGGKWRLRQRF